MAAAETEPQPIVEVRGLTKVYGHVPVLRDINLTVDPGDFTVVYGPPAAGKSVLMRLLMGLEQLTSGTIWLRGRDVTGVAPADRNIGYVPQSFALYPHLSVHDNIAYPLQLAGVKGSAAEPAVRQAAEMLNITDLLGKRPDQLSGGQKQRVAIARGIVKQTDLFIRDDPLAGLDFKLREQLVDDLKQLQQTWNVAFLYNTSDAIEALTLADHVAVLANGSIQEAGPPNRLYNAPEQRETMQLLGFPRTNFLTGRLSARPDGLRCLAGPFEFPVQLTEEHGAYWDGAPVSVGIRPESILLDGSGLDAGALRSSAQVLLREDLGGEEIVYLDARDTPLTTVIRHDVQSPAENDVTTIHLDPRRIFLFAVDGARIGQGAAR
jgi:ABC-type sugar transport system ATPase subunit